MVDFTSTHWFLFFVCFFLALDDFHLFTYSDLNNSSDELIFFL